MSKNRGAHGFQLVRWIGVAMVLPALVAVVLLAKDAAIVVERINETALKREAEALDRGVKLLGELHASELLSQTMWDAAFRNVVLAPKPNWIRQNFGKDALASEGIQHYFIVSPTGKVTFSSQHENAPPSAEEKQLLDVAKAPISRARDLYKAALEAGEGFGERLPGAMTDGIYVNDLVKLAGQPAMITVSPFTPDVEDHDAPTEPTLLIGVQMMTPELMDRLQSLSHIEGLAHVGPNSASNRNAPAHAVRDARGNVVANLTWDFTPPGEAIIRAALPAVAGSLFVIGLLTTLAAATMRRLTRRLAESEQAALHASRHDAATGLANRGWFMRSFAEILNPAEPEDDTSRAVMLIDCDYFKSVNDTLGHAAGDAVLAAIAERLKGLRTACAIAARLGGDEFALVTSPLRSSETGVERMHTVEAALTKPVLFDGHIIPVSVSIGVAVFDAPDDVSIDVLLAMADLALYRAKRDGRGCGRLFDPSLDGGEFAPVSVSNDPTLSTGEAA